MPKSLNEVLALPALEWRIADVLPLRGMAMLGGTPKLGKSRASIDLAQRVLRGRAVFGQFKPAPTQSILLYNIEGGYYGVRERDKGEPPSQMFKFLTREERERLMIEDRPILFTTAKGELRDAAVKQAIDAWSGYALVILDPLVHFRACDENNNQHTSVLFRAIRVAAEQANTSVIIVHHARKPATQNDDSEEGSTGNELRGASAAFGATDNVVMMSRNEAGLLCSFDLRYAPHRDPIILISDRRTGLLYPRRQFGNSMAPDPRDWVLDNGDDPEGYAEAFGYQPGFAERVIQEANEEVRE